MNWKYILIVVILAVIVGGGILAYQYWWVPKEEAKLPKIKAPEKVKDETANWKTYRNEDLGFELKYPKDLTIEKYPCADCLDSIRFKSGPSPPREPPFAEVLYPYYLKVRDRKLENIYPQIAQHWQKEQEFIMNKKPNEIFDCSKAVIYGYDNALCQVIKKEGYKFLVSVAPGYPGYHKWYIMYSDDYRFEFSIGEYDPFVNVRFEKCYTPNVIAANKNVLNECLNKALNNESVDSTWIQLDKIVSTFSLIETGWKFYQSSKMGFSMKYLPDWKVSEETLLATGVEIEFYKNNDIRIHLRTGVRYSQELAREYTLEEWIVQEKNWIKKYITEEIKEEDIILDDTPATKLAYKNIKENLTIYAIYTQKGGRLYEIITEINSAKEGVYNPIFDQVLSTFKFLE